jgi:hypothetical protein
MHFEPAHRHASLVGIGKVVVVRVDDLDEVRIIAYTEVVGNILEHNLNDGVDIRDT